MDALLSKISCIGMVPVVSISEKEDAAPLAHALEKADLEAMLCIGQNAADAITEIVKECPDMAVGAGNIIGLAQAKEAFQAGAKWITTSGLQEEVIRWCKDNQMVVIPGVSTASEIETAISYGLNCLQFFPAETSGGAEALKMFYETYADVRFVVSGGIQVKNLHIYLSQPNVLAAIGSFMLPEDALIQKDWERITQAGVQAVNDMLGYELIHLGINQNSCEEALQTAQTLCTLFGFQYYKKPKSHFAGRGFEILNAHGRGINGHIGIYTPYPEKAMYYLGKKGIRFVESSITRNKKTKLINFVYLDIEIAGFGVHLINPDVKMK